MLNIWYANDLPYGPRPIWARAHMGQGPYGPRAPGPRALPCWANTSPKNAPWKKESKLCFLCIFWKQKRCAASVRSFWRRYRAEISAMCQKTKVSVLRKNKLIHAKSSFIAHRSRAHFCFMKFIPINVLVPGVNGAGDRWVLMGVNGC